MVMRIFAALCSFLAVYLLIYLIYYTENLQHPYCIILGRLQYKQNVKTKGQGKRTNKRKTLRLNVQSEHEGPG